MNAKSSSPKCVEIIALTPWFADTTYICGIISINFLGCFSIKNIMWASSNFWICNSEQTIVLLWEMQISVIPSVQFTETA